MRSTRRTLLGGLGALGVSVGALFGSGAFTTVQAERDLEVNVLTDGEIGASDLFADLLIDVGRYGTVAVREADGTLNADGSGLFPTAEDNYGELSDTEFGEGYVSLLQNDVTIVFGFEDNRLSPNARTNYADLIALVNTNTNPTERLHTLGFDNEGFSEGTTVEFDDPTPEDVLVGGNEAAEFDVTVTSAAGGDTGGVLRLGVEPADQEEVPPPEGASFSVSDPTEDELFDFTVDPDKSVSGVDPVRLEFDEPVAEGLTSEDVTLRNLTANTPGNRRRLLIRQYGGSTAPVRVQGTIEVGEESVVVDGTAGGVELGEDPPTPDQVTLVRDGEDEVVEDDLGSEFIESQRLRVTGFSPEVAFDLDKVDIIYPEDTEFEGTDNGDFHFTREPETDSRQPIRVNNDTYDGNEVTLDVDQSGSNSKTFNPGETYTIEVAVDLSRATVDPGEVTLELKNRGGEVVETFTDGYWSAN